MIDDINKRRHLIKKSDGTEILYVEGVPIVEIHPMEFKIARTSDSYRMTLTQNLRNLSNTDAKAK